MAGRSRALKVLSRRAGSKFRPDAASPPKRDQTGAHRCNGLTSAARARCGTGKPPLCILPTSHFARLQRAQRPYFAQCHAALALFTAHPRPSAALRSPVRPAEPRSGRWPTLSNQHLWCRGGSAQTRHVGAAVSPLGSAPPPARSRAAGDRLWLTGWALHPPKRLKSSV